MSKIQFKKETIDLVDVMIQHADKGPSGFWVEDYKGCGNPRIFPEFSKGLKNGRLVQKEHYLCPWNTAILFGSGHGNIQTGCYYSCSIREAKYFSEKQLKTLLSRFKKRMQSGKYDNLEHIQPLLTENEQNYIQNQKALEGKKEEQHRKAVQNSKAKASASLRRKYSDNEEIQELLLAYYGDNIVVRLGYGNLDFSPSKISNIVAKKVPTYDEYLDVQIQSFGKQRTWFMTCYHNIPDAFKGRIEKISHGKICFQRVYVSGMFSEDGSFFNGKEDHVWMDLCGFEEFNVGDYVSFFAEVYPYIKTGRGKILDYGLRNPANIQKIGAYQLPSDDDLIRQSIEELICETCYLSEHCNNGFCIRNPQELQALKRQMFVTIKNAREKQP